MPDDPPKPPRFPYVGVLLCAACLGAAVWTWMRYSYCWDLAPAHLTSRDQDIVARRWPSQSFVRITPFECGTVFNYNDEPWDPGVLDEYPKEFLHHPLPVEREVYFIAREPADVPYTTTALSGRVVGVSILDVHTNTPHRDRTTVTVWVDSRASRFHGASIAGLVVGAMGVFVFTVALRHWQRERKAAMGREYS